MQNQIYMLHVFNACKTFYLVYFAKDVEDWFGYDKLNAFLSHKWLIFNVLI